MGPRFPAERFGFSGGKAKDFALAFGIGPDSHYCSGGNDTPSLPAFYVGGVDPEIGPLAFNRAVQEGLHTLVYFFAQPADLALRDARVRWETVHWTVSFSSSPRRLDQVIDGACGDALDVGFCGCHPKCR
jgi:hypothetical protein